MQPPAGCACGPTAGTRGAVRRGALLTALLVAAMARPAVAQSGGAAGDVPTPVEQALMEFACRVPGQAMPAPAVYETCLGAQLRVLRTDFGRDLQKLSAAERRTIDRTCSAVRTARGRDAYVGCMSEQLQSLKAKRAASAPAQNSRPDVTAEPQSLPIEQAAALLPTRAEPPIAEAGTPVWLIALALVAVGGGAWYLLAGRPRRPSVHLCRVCGADAGSTGDLCPPCRHEAAVSQRRALAERDEQQRAVAEHARRALDDAEARSKEEARLREEEAAEAARLAQAAADAEAERQREFTRQRDVELKRWQAAAAAAIGAPASEIAAPGEGPFDPHAVLGVAKTATEAEVRAAYEQGRQKYAADQVAHLGIELQDLYRAKAERIERAFEMLSAPARV